ncbi:radical SAM protein [Candidatus Parcubacteria bacterium]|nr:radical SAM protein [Candidatus Parcubacteria bacterium]
MNEKMVCGKLFYLQWHITEKCLNNCRHCYSFGKRMQEETTLVDFIAIFDDVLEFCNRIGGRAAQITLIGGDPMLHPHFREFVNILVRYPQVRIIIAGNPETLTKEYMDWLRGKVFAFQVSVDGNEETHDWFRYPGSYRNTLDCIRNASEDGIRVHAMTTVSKKNVGHLEEIMHAVYQAGAHRWAFARYVPPVGQTLNLDPQDFWDALGRIEKAHSRYESKGYDKQRKDPLWFPFRNIDNPPNPGDNPNHCQVDGCGIGSPTIGILPDNTIMACRRHAGSGLGRWEKKGDLFRLFMHSSTMKQLRNVVAINKCRDCHFLYYCRGCRAIGYAVRGILTDPDPTCLILKQKEVI